jgi:hypothetical protein
MRGTARESLCCPRRDRCRASGTDTDTGIGIGIIALSSLGLRLGLGLGSCGLLSCTLGLGRPGRLRGL